MENKNVVLKFIAPSQFEVLLLVIIAIGVIAASIYTVFFSSPEVKQYFNYQEQNPTGIYESVTTVNSEVNQSKFAADTAIFLFWSTVGMISYSVVSSLKRLVQSLGEFEKNLVDKRLKKSVLFREAFLKLLLRFIGILLLVGALFVSAYLLNDVLLRTLADSTNDYSKIATSLLAAVLAVIVTGHLATIALRLVRLRVRTFGSIV